MLLVPLQDVRERSPWELASDNAIANRDRDFIVSVDGVKMRWVMISIQDSDSNPKEATDNWYF
jgi:hypothetical protein